MGAGFIGLEADYFMLFLYGIAISLLYCSLNSRKKEVKRLCSAAIIAHAVILALTMKKIKFGFYVIIDAYLALIERSPMFTAETVEIYGSEKFYATLAAAFILTFVIAGLSIACCYKTNFLFAFILTFPFFEIGAFWGEVPNHLAFYTLLICWVSIFAMQISGWNSIRSRSKAAYKLKPRSNQFFISSKSLIVYSGTLIAKIVAVFSCCVLLTAFILGSFFRERSVTINELRSTIKNAAENFSFENIPDIVNEIVIDIDFIPTKSVGGINGGKLGRTGKLTFNGRTALEVDLTINSILPSCLYLKGYCAGVYSGSSWDQLSASVYSDHEYLFDDYDKINYQNYNAAAVEYACLQDNDKVFSRGKGTLDVRVKNASSKYLYEPYYTFERDSDAYKLTEETFVKAKKSSYSLDFYSSYGDVNPFKNVNSVLLELPTGSLDSSSSTYYLNPTGNNFYNEYIKFVEDNYMDFDAKVIRNAYNDIVANYMKEINVPYEYDCATNGFINYKDFNLDAQYVAWAIRDYFSENFTYDLSPGKTPGNEDFVQYFLEEQKKGYCSYFASAGVLLMRAFGYPARFAEGYIALESDFSLNTDNYTYTAKLSDKSAHAWCEVFLPDFGWLPVEFTPGYSNGENPNYNSSNSSSTSTTTTTVTTAVPPVSSSVTTTTTKSDEIKTSPGGVVTDESDNSQTSTTTPSDLDNDPSSSFGYMAVFKFILKILVVIFIILMIIAVWNHIRVIRLNALKRRLSNADRNKAVIAIYKHYLELLTLIGISTKKNITDMDNADDIAEQCYKINIVNMSTHFKKLTEIAVEADMSTNKISETSYKFAINELKRISDVVWSRLDKTSAFYAKYIRFMY